MTISQARLSRTIFAPPVALPTSLFLMADPPATETPPVTTTPSLAWPDPSLYCATPHRKGSGQTPWWGPVTGSYLTVHILCVDPVSASPREAFPQQPLAFGAVATRSQRGCARHSHNHLAIGSVASRSQRNRVRRPRTISQSLMTHGHPTPSGHTSPR